MIEVPLSKAYRFLEPGPVVLVTTALHGRPNIMTMSYHMMVEDQRPLIGCSLGPWNHSYEAFRATGECVVAVPAADLVETVVDIGNCSGDTVDKFKTFGLTPLPADLVAPPLVAQCLANLECRVSDTSLAEEYNFFILEVVKAWTDPDREERRMIHHNGDGTFTLDGERLDLKHRMTRWPGYIA